MLGVIKYRENKQRKSLIQPKWLFMGLVLLSFLLKGAILFGQDGSALFRANCASCHKTSEKRLVGPGLAGINEKRSAEWLQKWIKDSPAMIASGDADAVAIFEEYNQMPMPAVTLSPEEITTILNFVDAENGVLAGGGEDASGTTAAVTPVISAPPMEAPPKPADQLIMYSMIFCIAIILVILAATLMRTNRIIREHGGLDKNKINVVQTFLVMAIIGCFVVYLFKAGMSDASSMLNYLMFAAFPYVATVVFLIGSIYRYRQNGFKVSSLSSQFLEGKKLFWGSQPFHWGILFLFFGHLVAFLFPRAVIAWNGQPVRLVILEVSAFAFGLAALLGLILFIRRRLTSNRVQMVSNKMDMLVYVVLLLQIISGLFVAYSARWGSSWFAGVLTPYLKSLFVMNPQIDAVSAMPWMVQLHIVSAFSIVAVIPFTRFVHFLVAPIDYLWRRYQVVIWNWNKKDIRNSTSYFPGKKARNH